ncbi:hypothetical protein [Bartonella sp. WD12.1]|nr:hypothetical protein [Bartonella sp. WD12.1]
MRHGDFMTNVDGMSVIWSYQECGDCRRCRRDIVCAGVFDDVEGAR